MTDEDLAYRYFDEHQGPSLSRDGIPSEVVDSLRQRYVRDALANPEAVRQLRETV